MSTPPLSHVVSDALNCSLGVSFSNFLQRYDRQKTDDPLKEALEFYIASRPKADRDSGATRVLTELIEALRDALPVPNEQITAHRMYHVLLMLSELRPQPGRRFHAWVESAVFPTEISP